MVDNRVKCDGISCKDCPIYMRIDACAYMRYVDLTFRAEWYILHNTDIDISKLT